MPAMTRNRLEDATSPYLLQHAAQPVHWQPWDDAAIGLARRLDRPILLSIGYSACHWCHVMAHESFEDAGIASLLNESFVCIKVDREERPDLDRVYQLALTLLTRDGGGWPLTVFLDPASLVPFFGGTYFPKNARHGLPGFADLLLRVNQVFTERRDELEGQCEKIAELLTELNAPGASQQQVADEALLDAASEQLEGQYDPAEGGFGQAPKFPMPPAVERLLLGWARSRRQGDPDRDTLERVMHTLTRMARGGIFDHLGGGFCRYSTDRKWLVPHFEKMLSDNGQLLALYADAYAVSGDELFRDTITATAGWLLRDMRHPGGAFRAAVSADSEGQEGRYYVWRRDEVRRLLSEDEYLVAETLYGLDKPANFEGRWILHRRDAWRAVVERLSLERADADRLLDAARAKLLAARTTGRARDRREDPDRLERTRGQGARPRRAVARQSGMARGRARGSRLSAHRTLARGRAARQLDRRHRRVSGLSRRSRESAGRVARAAARGLARGRRTVRHRTGGRPDRELRGPRTRRFLLHPA